MSIKFRSRALFGLVIICTSWIVGCGDDKAAAPAAGAPTTPPAGGAPDDAAKPKTP